MQLLPLYTKRQIEIAYEIEEYRKYDYTIPKIFKEIEFTLQPLMEKIANELLNDKKFIKALKILGKKNERTTSTKIQTKNKKRITKSR